MSLAAQPVDGGIGVEHVDYEITNNAAWFVPDRRFYDRRFVEGLIMAVLVDQEVARREHENIRRRGSGKDLTPYDVKVLLDDAKAIVDAFIDAGVSCRRGIPRNGQQSNQSRDQQSTTTRERETTQ